MSVSRFVVSSLMSLASVVVPAQSVEDSLGVYAVTDVGMQKMEVLAYQDVEAGNFFASALTVGLVPMKGVFVFKGNTSTHHFKKRARMRMFFRGNNAPTTAEQIMFDTCYSVPDFHIAKFEAKKNKRRLTAIKTTIIKADEGVDFVDEMKVWYKKTRKGVYDVYIDGKPGEYCLVFTGVKGNWGGYVYDFTIDP